MPSPLQLGFNVWGSELWSSGYVYTGALLQTLKEIYGAQVGLNLLLHVNQEAPPVLADVADTILRWQSPPRWSKTWLLERVPKRVFHYDITATRLLQAHDIRVIVFGAAPQGSKIPSIEQVPDLQPFHFPEFFPPAELARLTRDFQQMAQRATRLLVYSNAVRADIARFAPAALEKVRVAAPAIHLPPDVYEMDITAVREKYHLPDKFFYLPNQFWQHKNHLLVLDALAQLKPRGIKPYVVMSGALADHRAPDYPAQFLRRVSELDLRAQIVVLGLVPRADVFALMRACLAVINPSLFEGHGLTVAEARWLGKQVLLSDIPAHREQNPPQALYFDPQDADALAEGMKQLWYNAAPEADRAREAEARRDYPAHKRASAAAFMAVVNELLDGTVHSL